MGSKGHTTVLNGDHSCDCSYGSFIEAVMLFKLFNQGHGESSL